MFPPPTVSFVRGLDRDLIQADEANALKSSGTLIIDERRTRTRYFDGRFLAAKDEIRDQNYFLTRLADLGRAAGAGVVSGLMVDRTSGTVVTIHGGQGVTPAGETVMVQADLAVSLADIAAAEQLDVSFGLSRIPAPLARNRSGLFLIGLRPVEYTANPVSSYPTTLNGPRTVQDGDIIEATAIVLVPYREQGQQGTADTRQSRVARTIFLDGGALGTPENVLPLAMISMDRGVVQWVDAWMVRREMGAEQGNVLGFGFSPRALREAYLQQYVNQLNGILQQRSGANLSPKFAASDYFHALPSAGLLPAAAIDPADFSQIFFPPQIQTDLSIIPDDELASLVVDSFLLPPIDLTQGPDELESTSVLVLVPVPRVLLPGLKTALTNLLTPLRPAAPGLVFQRKPIESLLGLTAVRVAPPPINTGSVADVAWRNALALNPLLWYTRRRNLQAREDVAAGRVLVGSNDAELDVSVLKGLQEAGLQDRMNAIKAKASSVAWADLLARLASPAVKTNPVLAASVLSQLEKVQTVDQATVINVTEPLTDPQLGEGLARLGQVNPELNDPRVIKALGDSAAAPLLDVIGRGLDKTKLNDLSKQVIAIAKTGGTAAPATIAELLKRHLVGPS
jgi:hypothetical protein